MDKYMIGKATDTGRARQVNEDSMTVFNSPNGLVLAVCDGMGGQAAGDTASQLTAGIIESILTDNTFATPQEAIQRAVMAANQGVLNKAAQTPELEGMGSTCAIIIVKDNTAYYGWVGDSRIYYIANHTIRQVSHDQSYVQQMVDNGEITPEEAVAHPQRNEILNCIGLQGMTPPVIGAPVSPEPGSVFLVCSDGLSNMVSDAQIERTVSNDRLTPQQKADRLVEMANEAGGLDNITVGIIQFAGQDATRTSTAPTGGKSRRGRLPVLAALVALALAVTGAGYMFLSGSDDGGTPATVQPRKPQKGNDGKSPSAPAAEERKDEGSDEKKEQPAAATNTPRQQQPATRPADNARGAGGNAIERNAPAHNDGETAGGKDENLQGAIRELSNPGVEPKADKDIILEKP